MTPSFALALLIGVVVAVSETSAQDCWWTGCQPNDWAVVGCAHYGRDEMGKKRCKDGRGKSGFKYNCCAKSGGGGGGGGEGGEGEGEEEDDDVQLDDDMDGGRDARSCMGDGRYGCSESGPYCCSGFCCRWPGQSRGVCKQPGDCRL